MATSATEGVSESLKNKIDFDKVSLPIIPGKVNGTPVKALFSSGSKGCYMTMACVERCQLSNIMDTRSPGDMISIFGKDIPLLGAVRVSIEFQVKLPNGEMKTVRYPTLFYVTEKDIVEIVLGGRFPVDMYTPGKLFFEGGEIPFLPKGEWDEPARSAQSIIATRSVKLHTPYAK